jgi:hypothetical protein
MCYAGAPVFRKGGEVVSGSKKGIDRYGQPDSSYQPGAFKPPPKREARPPLKPFKPLEAKQPEGSNALRIILVLILIGIVLGGYYGYCRYKIADKVYALSQAFGGLHMALMALQPPVEAADIKDFALDKAEAHGVEASPDDILVSIMPMNDQSMRKLPSVAQMGLGIAAKIPKSNKPKWVLGFKGRFSASHGIAKRTFELERYTWFLDDVRP